MKLKVGTLLALLALVVLGYNACEDTKTSVLNSTIMGNPGDDVGTMAIILPYEPAYQHVACLSKMTLYGIGTTQASTINYDPPKTIRLDPKGTDIDNLTLPNGTYAKIKLLFSEGCNSPDIPADKVFVVNKADAQISVSSPLELRFLGVYQVPEMLDIDLFFNFQAYIDVFSSATSELEIREGVSQTAGTFGPQTKASVLPSTLGTFTGCLTSASIRSNTGLYPVVFVPRIITMNSSHTRLPDFGLSPGTTTKITLSFRPRCPELPPNIAFEMTGTNGIQSSKGLDMLFIGTFAVPQDREKGIEFKLSTFPDSLPTLDSTQTYNTCTGGTFAAGTEAE